MSGTEIAPRAATGSGRAASARPASADPTPVTAAIAAASRRTGVDFDFLMAQAQIESGLDPAARAPTSSATGLFQFTDATWLAMLDRHGDEHGLGWASAAISGGRVTDQALAAPIMALRRDPATSALMAGELAQDNGAILAAALGREPDAAELYLGHFLGSGDAVTLLRQNAADSGQSAAALLPGPAAANRGIFYRRDGSSRSVGEVLDQVRAKVTIAIEQVAAGQLGAEWGAHRARSAMASSAPEPARQRPSMAQSLLTTFAANQDLAHAPAAVQRAYRRIEGAGL